VQGGALPDSQPALTPRNHLRRGKPALLSVIAAPEHHVRCGKRLKRAMMSRCSRAERRFSGEPSASNRATSVLLIDQRLECTKRHVREGSARSFSHRRSKPLARARAVTGTRFRVRREGARRGAKQVSRELVEHDDGARPRPASPPCGEVASAATREGLESAS